MPKSGKPVLRGALIRKSKKTTGLYAPLGFKLQSAAADGQRLSRAVTVISNQKSTDDETITKNTTGTRSWKYTDLERDRSATRTFGGKRWQARPSDVTRTRNLNDHCAICRPFAGNCVIFVWWQRVAHGRPDGGRPVGGGDLERVGGAQETTHPRTQRIPPISYTLCVSSRLFFAEFPRSAHRASARNYNHCTLLFAHINT